MANLMDGLLEELNRNYELLTLYKSIPTGGFGAVMIEADIKAGNNAIASGDVVEMMCAFKKLKNNE